MNLIIEQAKTHGREYVTPEDVEDVLATGADINLVRRDVLLCLANQEPFGVEDRSLFAFVATEEQT